jgi:hypothetical protein
MHSSVLADTLCMGLSFAKASRSLNYGRGLCLTQPFRQDSISLQNLWSSTTNLRLLSFAIRTRDKRQHFMSEHVHWLLNVSPARYRRQIQRYILIKFDDFGVGARRTNIEKEESASLFVLYTAVAATPIRHRSKPQNIHTPAVPERLSLEKYLESGRRALTNER